MDVIYTTEYGSKLYGTSTPQSDTDIKQIVVPYLSSMLIGTKLTNKVKRTNTTTEKNTHGDIDRESIPIQIFARDFMMGQTYALEIAFSVGGTHASQMVTHPLFVEFVNQLKTNFLTSNIKALMGYAVNQASLYSFKGERLNASKDALQVLQQVMTNHPHTDKLSVHANAFHGVLEKHKKYFKQTEYDGGNGKQYPCFVLLEKTLPFTNELRMTEKVITALIEKYGNRANDASIDNVDWKATMHAVRIVDLGLQLLETKQMSFPLDDISVKRLLSIKRGEVPIAEISNELDTKLSRLKILETATTLPAYDQNIQKRFDQWLADQMVQFYGIKQMSTVIGEAYQAVGVLAERCGLFNDRKIIMLLDNLSMETTVHTDILPLTFDEDNV